MTFREEFGSFDRHQKNDVESDLGTRDEATQKAILKAVNTELQEVIKSMAPLEEVQRTKVFERMGKGPEATSDDPLVTDLFEKIQQTEDTYGRESVEEIARLYGVR